MITKARRRGSSDESTFSSSCSDIESQSAVAQSAPLLAFVKASDDSTIQVYSLRQATTVHVFRFNSTVLRFATPASNKQGRLLVMLSEG